jgi:tape measure domain-containing protein
MSVNLGSMVVNLTMNTAGMVKSIAMVETKVARMATKIKSAGDKTRQMGVGLTAGLTAPLVAVAGMALKASAELETMEVGFQSMLGSADKASAMMKEIASFTAKTPFQIGDVAKSTRQLLAFGVAGNDVLDTLKFLGDISAGANVPLNEISATYGKIITKNKAYTEELNQLAERGVPIYNVLSKQLGVSKDELFKLASQGKISAKIVTRALKGMTTEGGIFADQMAKQSETLAGIWSTLKDNLFLLSAEIGNMITETVDIKAFMKDVIEVVQSAVKWFNSLDQATRKQILAFVAIAGAIGPVLIVLGTLISSVGAVVGAISAIAGSTIIGPIILLAVAIGSIVLALKAIVDDSKKAQEAIGSLGAEGKKQTDNWNLSLSEWATVFKTTWNVLVEHVKHAWNTISILIGRAFSKIVNGVMTAIETILASVSNLVQALAEAEIFFAKSEADAITKFLTPDFSQARQMDKELARMQAQEDRRHANRMREIFAVNLAKPTEKEIEDARKRLRRDTDFGDGAVTATNLPTEPIQKFAGAVEFGSLQDYRIRRGLVSREDKLNMENKDANVKTADNTAEALEELKEMNSKLTNTETKGID